MKNVIRYIAEKVIGLKHFGQDNIRQTLPWSEQAVDLYNLDDDEASIRSNLLMEMYEEY